MKPVEQELNDQPRIAEAHLRQLNRLRALLSGTPRSAESDSAPSPSAPISTQAFGGFLMQARTEEQVRSLILANPKAAAHFVQQASSTDSFVAGHPPDTMHAAGEVDHPFFILGWLQGGDLARTR